MSSLRSRVFPHVEKCADCGAALLLPEEFRKVQEERKRVEETTLANMVVVREGDMDWLRELREVLIDAGIPCAVQSDAGCKKAVAGLRAGWWSPQMTLERARGSNREYYMEVSPEFRHFERIAQRRKVSGLRFICGHWAIESARIAGCPCSSLKRSELSLG